MELVTPTIKNLTETPATVSLRIQSKCGKIPTRITPNTDTFHAVIAQDYFLFK